jgi:hypothetical protein
VVPYWASSLVKAANVGTHIFYRWTGGWGRPPAFRTAYAGAEPQLAAMRNLSSIPPAVMPDAEAAIQLAATPAEGALPGAGLADSKVVRRYEPLRQQAADAELATQLSGGSYVPSTHNWALTGKQTGPAEVALGKKVAAAPTPEPCAAPAKTRKYGPPGGYGVNC